MRRSEIVAALAAAALLGACAAPASQVKVKEGAPFPERFAAAPEEAPSAAGLPWRELFDDPRLVALIDQGLAESPEVGQALARIEATRARVTLATGAIFPRVEAAAGVGLRRFGRFTMDGAGNASTEIVAGRLVPEHLPSLGLGLQASWEVDLWGRLGAERQSAVAEVAASVEGAHLVQSALVADIATAWFELRALDRVQEVLRATIERQGLALETVRLQKLAGRANELAVQQFEGQLAETRALEVDVGQEIVARENALNALVGRFPTPVERAGEVAFAPPRALAVGLPAELLARRPDVRLAERRMQAAELDVRAARAAFLPRLDLGAAVGIEAFEPGFLFRPESIAYSALGGLVAPLFNRAGLEAQLEATEAGQREAIYGYRQVVLDAFAEAVTSVAAVTAAEARVRRKLEQKAAIERSVETADLLYRAGKASYLEVLVAQQSTLRADLELVEAWRLQQLASVRLYRVLGGGWTEIDPRAPQLSEARARPGPERARP